MRYEIIECVVLERDITEHGLHRGDLGAVVELYPPDGIEVEFVTATGETKAVLTLREPDVRKAGREDIVSVRSA